MLKGMNGMVPVRAPHRRGLGAGGLGSDPDRASDVDADKVVSITF